MFVVVPKQVEDAINATLDAAIAESDEPVTASDREHLYRELLKYYDEHGHVPTEIVLTKDDLQSEGTTWLRPMTRMGVDAKDQQAKNSISPTRLPTTAGKPANHF